MSSASSQCQRGIILAGYLAASMSETGKIGFVGGMKIPNIEDFVGLEAGAGTEPDIFYQVEYANSFSDLKKARDCARIENGVDIILPEA